MKLLLRRTLVLLYTKKQAKGKSEKWRCTIDFSQYNKVLNVEVSDTTGDATTNKC